MLAALAVWVIGRWLIGMTLNVFSRAMLAGKKVDATLANYLRAILSVMLTMVLILAIFDIFRVKTTSFAVLLAGAGLAIGTAWGGLLQHFAAGVFMQVLRPFKVGDFVQAVGVTGTVTEIGLFGTTLATPDNVHIISGSIQNFSTLPHRRVDCVAKVTNSVDPLDAIARLKPAIAAIANVKESPAPEIEILQFTPEGPLLAVRPY